MSNRYGKDVRDPDPDPFQESSDGAPWMEDDIQRKLARESWKDRSSPWRSPLPPWRDMGIMSVSDLLFEYEEEIRVLRRDHEQLLDANTSLCSKLDQAEYRIEELKKNLTDPSEIARVQRELRAKSDAVGLLQKAFDEHFRVGLVELEATDRTKRVLEELREKSTRLEKERDEAVAKTTRLEQERNEAVEKLGTIDRAKSQDLTIEVRVVDMGDD